MKTAFSVSKPGQWYRKSGWFCLFIVSLSLLVVSCSPQKMVRTSPPVIKPMVMPSVAGRGVCFLGSSEPWTDTETTWAEAGDAAVMDLFMKFCTVSTRSGNLSIQGTDIGSTSILVSIHETCGILTGVRVVGWWLDRKGVGPRHQCGDRCSEATVWAVACIEGFEGNAASLLPEAFTGSFPAWLKNKRSESNSICATGVSDRTFDADDAKQYAVADARRNLARAICGVGKFAFVDKAAGGVGQFAFAHFTPHELATEYVNGYSDGKQEQVDVWLDSKGQGPLGTAGAAYARVCVPRGVIDCPVTPDCSVH